MSQPLLVSPQEFFRGRVTEASSNLKLMLGEDIEFYLVKLLCDFIEPEKIVEPIAEDYANPLEAPLALMLKKAQETSTPEQKIRIFRILGDTSLYVAGYFQDYFNRKTFDISYYMNMGSSAYSSISDLMREDRTSAVYTELAEFFPQLVDVVAEIADVNDPSDNKDLLSIYDRWNRAPSPRLRKILSEAGIKPVKVPTKFEQ